MKTIMIIEDQPDLQILLKILVERLGYMALVASNGEEALHQLELLKEKPRLILCDMMMPGNGWHFIETISENSALVAVPVVAMSAAFESVKKTVPAHARGFVKKIFTLDALMHVIKEFEIK